MKKFIIFILILFLIHSYNSIGQGFNNVYDFSSINGNGLILQRAVEFDSCYVISNNVSGSENEFFIKIAKDGTILNSKEFDFNKNFYSGEGPTLCKINNNDFFYFHSTTDDHSILIARLNNNLDTLWTKYYGGDTVYSKLTKSAYFDSLTSSIILVGKKRQFSSIVYDVWILRVSITDGTILSDTTYNFTSSNIFNIGTLIKTNDNGYIIPCGKNGKWSLLKLDSRTLKTA